ncbi:3'(2'),5'-bisphosphate nucleotidase CysQ [Mycobacterium sp. M1]|uniref:3'(2'),5-bisphosphonucleoside 3'(2')-phosphohydrolase n=1 Tax=Mycolicibacter acidiphilus TaxID=2835306 RepID=A0ABS5RJ95_9MYCO|nr:inositol monophosphatase family protein [Mycolicibacter acidiphilus]MBS9533014.1 3'(2'),5'-bisphosphate nucleotidase CysQ [Mycolicibacter acidiphilus]
MTLTDAALAAELAADAGQLLLAVRDEVGFDQPWRLGDIGDQMANDRILKRLKEVRPDDAVLSEESPDNLIRLRSDRVWIIDPLDGTREFTTRGRDDWAVHIALWQRDGDGPGVITDAAVGLPAYGNVVYRTDTVAERAPLTGALQTIRVAVSANRMPALLRRLRPTVPIEPVPMGSAGAKAMAVVRGDVDAYLHAGGQWEWDSAAPAGVVLAAGLHASRLDGSPLRYNRPDPYLPDLLMCRHEVAPILLDAIRQALL